MAEYLIFGALFTLLIFLLQVQFKKQGDKIDCLENDKNKIEMELQRLDGKLWSEEKLTKTINNSVEATLNKWMLEQIKSGSIKFGGKE